MGFAQAKKSREARKDKQQQSKRVGSNMIKLRNLGHEPSQVGTRIKCSMCARSVHRNNVASWCGLGRRIPWIEHQPKIQVGTQTIHASHRIAQYRGLVWCWRCGLVGQSRLQGLAAECRPVRARGQRNLSKLRKGQPPPQYEWPQAPTTEPFPLEPA